MLKEQDNDLELELLDLEKRGMEEKDAVKKLTNISHEVQSGTRRSDNIGQELNREVDRLRDYIDDRDNDYDASEQEITSKATELAELFDYNEEMEDKLIQNTQELLELKNDVEELEDNVETQVEIKEELEQKVRELEYDVKELENSIVRYACKLILF